MSEVDIGIAVKASKKLESQLTESFAAEGKGLHEKITSVESKLPHSLIKKLRYIASIRNKVVHEEDFSIDNIEHFQSVGAEALAELERIVQLKKQAQEKALAKAKEQQKVQTKQNNQTREQPKHQTQQASTGKLIAFILLATVITWLFSEMSQNKPQTKQSTQLPAVVKTDKVKAEKVDSVNINPDAQKSFPEKTSPEINSPEQVALKEVKPQLVKPEQLKSEQVKPEQVKSEAAVTQPKQPSLNNDVASASNTVKATESAASTTSAAQTPTVSTKAFSLNDKKNAYQQKMHQTQTSVYQALTDIASSTFTLGEINVQPQGSRNTLYIPINYQLSSKVTEVLKQHLPLKEQRRKPLATISTFNVKEDPFTSDLYQWLVKSDVTLVVKAGSHSTKLNLAMGLECFVSCRGKGTDEYHLLTQSAPGESTLLYKQHNALELNGISDSQLSNINQISGYIEVKGLSGFDSLSIPVFNLPVEGKSLTDNAQANQDALKVAKQQIDEQLTQLLQHTAISIGEVDVTQADNRATVHVPVSWQFDKKAINDILAPHLEFTSHKQLLTIKDFSNQNDKLKQPYSYDLLKHLFTKTVLIEVSAGKHSATLTLGSPMKCFVSCSSTSVSAADSYQLILQGDSSSKKLIYKQTNPIAISNIPVADLDNISGIQARVIVK